MESSSPSFWIFEIVKACGIAWLVWQQIRPSDRYTKLEESITSMRDALLAEIRRETTLMDKRVSILEEQAQWQVKISKESEEVLKGLRTEIHAMHTDIRVLNAHGVSALRNVELMLGIKDLLVRVEAKMQDGTA